MDDRSQFWGGVALIVVGTLVLFAPLAVELVYGPVLLIAAVLVLAAGAVLVGLSRRGRAV